jgi:hypothetical protein
MKSVPLFPRPVAWPSAALLYTKRGSLKCGDA